MTTQLIEAARLALGAMEAAIKAGDWKVDGACDPDMALVALRAALTDAALERKAENARELGLDYEQPCPYVVSTREGTHHCSLAQREPLTDEQIKQIELSLRQYNTRDTYDLSLNDFARAIEQAHGIKGEA